MEGMATVSELKAKLLSQADAGERGAPLIFAGRRESLESLTRSTLHKVPQRHSGNTFVISGPPGAGKTALAQESIRLLEARGGKAVYRGDVPGDEHTQAVYRKVLTALGGVPTPDSTVERTALTVEAKALGTGGSRQTASERRRSGAHLDAEEIAAALGPDRLAKAPPVCVLIDEAQNVEPKSSAARLMRDLHTQRTLPVTLVCLGLDDLDIRLNRAEVSPRVNEASRIRLGGYTPDEALECAVGAVSTARGWGVAGSDAQASAWALALVEAADGWPRHMQCYLNASWQVLAEQPGSPSLDNGLDEVLERGRQLRDVYYRSRIILSELPLAVIGPVHALLEERREVHRDSILDEIDHCLDEGLGDAAGKRVRSRFADAAGVFNALLHVGLIAQDGSLMCASPIPSMSAHVIEGCKSQGIELARPGRPADLPPTTPRQRGVRP